MTMNALTYGRIEQTAKKIIGFGAVQPGWHYGEGVPPRHEVIQKALALNVEAGYVGFGRTNAFLGVDGEIRVTAYQGPIYLELTVEPNETVTLVAEQDGTELTYEENLSFENALARVRTFRSRIWALSGLSISTSTTLKLDVSKALPSDHPVTEVEYPLSKKIAFYRQAQVSASISKDTTKISREPRLYSGTYSQDFFLKSASSSKRQVELAMIATTT